MNLDVVVSVLDLISFLLCAPELVRPERLRAFREWALKHLGKAALEHDESMLLFAIIAALVSAALLYGVVRFFLWVFTWQDKMLQMAVVQDFAGLLGGLIVVMLLYSISFIYLAMLRSTITHFMLGVGAVVFVLSRGLSIWSALHPHS